MFIEGRTISSYGSGDNIWFRMYFHRSAFMKLEDRQDGVYKTVSVHVIGCYKHHLRLWTFNRTEEKCTVKSNAVRFELFFNDVRQRNRVVKWGKEHEELCPVFR